MKSCNQSTITDSAFKYLTNLRSLKIIGCRQSTITDFCFHSPSKTDIVEHDRLQSADHYRCSIPTLDELGLPERKLLLPVDDRRR